jgi:tRNA(fMet)-specific endonuclease VapC
MIVLDTNIIIYLLNGNKRVAAKLNEYSPQEVMTSFITLGELIFGAYHSKRFEHNLHALIKFTDTIRVIHSSPRLARSYGELKHQSLKSGCFPGDHDLWIAATALQQQATLITNNTKHYQWIKSLESKDWI